MILVFALAEGVAIDWMPVAIIKGHQTAEWIGVATLAIFLAAMTCGRLFGTMALDRWGRVTCLRITAVMVTIGTIVVVFGPVVTVPIGAICWGIGASLGFPVGMSAAADDPLRAASRVSVVGVISYTAFLGGPPVIGFIADHVGLLNALLLIAFLSLLSLLIIPVAKPLQHTSSD